jgi:hypothetical protein
VCALNPGRPENRDLRLSPSQLSTGLVRMRLDLRACSDLGDKGGKTGLLCSAGPAQQFPESLRFRGRQVRNTGGTALERVSQPRATGDTVKT